MSNNDTTAGWKLVPVEPTPEMVHALADNVDLIDYEGGSRAGYAAMLAAAPQPPAAPQPAIADHTCASTDLVDHESSKLSDKPTGGSPDHLLQDQSRGLSQWLASQPGARLHAREAAAAIVAQHGEAVAPDDDHPTLRGCIETIKQAHDACLNDEHMSARVMLRDVVADLEQIATQPAAAPQPVAQGDDLLEIARRTGLRQHLHGVNATDARALLSAFMAAAAPAVVVGEPVYQCQGADGRWTDQARASYDYNLRHGQAGRVLYTAPQPPAAPRPVAHGSDHLNGERNA